MPQNLIALYHFIPVTKLFKSWIHNLSIIYPCRFIMGKFRSKLDVMASAKQSPIRQAADYADLN